MYALAVPPKADLPIHTPSHRDEVYISEALAYLNMTTPFWSSALYTSMVIRHTRSDYVPWAATDSHVIYVNVAGMRKSGWTFEEVAFVLAHEVVHFLLGDLFMGVFWRDQNSIHCPDGTVLPYDHNEMNIAMDLRINPMLIEGKVGKMPREGWFDPSLSAKGMESCVEIYQKRWQRKQQQGGGPSGQKPGTGGGFDIHLDPQPQAIEQDKANGNMRRAQAIASAQMAAEAAGLGSMPAAIAALIGAILHPRVKWQDHLRACVMRASGVPANDWAKLNKRMISRPEPWGRIAFARRSGYGCGTVVVGYDTSGSCINEKTQQRFFSEMSGIVADLNPEQLIVIWCDTKVQRVDELETPTDLEELRADINEAGGAPGGGGTDLRKIFDHIRDEGIEPDMAIILTDMYTPFPDEPEYPCIWASILPNRTAPFGDYVECGEMD